MSANIFGERFLGRRQPAWHRLGKTFDAPIGALEAIEAAGLDYMVRKVPVQAQVAEADGVSTSIPLHQLAVMREPTSDDPEWRHFGFVSEGYGLLQNTDIAKIVDPLTERWPVETAGALGYGETMFLVLAAGETAVAGVDPVRNFFFVTDTKDGRTSLSIAFTPVRVVCQNTLVTGLKAARVATRLTHHSEVGDELDFRVFLLGQLQRAQTVGEYFEALAAMVLDAEAVDRVLLEVYPDRLRGSRAALAAEVLDEDLGEYDILKQYLEKAQESAEYSRARMGTFRAGVRELLGRFNDSNPTLVNTGWAVYNSVVEVEDYRNGRENVDVSLLFGSRARRKAKAMTAVLAENRR